MNAPRRALTPAELLQFAGILRAQGKLAEAEAAFRRVVQLLPDEPAAATGLGLLLGEKGDMAEALNWLRRACALAPTNAEMHNNLGRLARAGGVLEEALASFQTALTLAPHQPEAHYNCAQALAALGRQHEAVAAWRAAIALAPGLAPAHFQLGVALQTAGDFPAAREHLRQAAPGHPAASAALARLLAAMGEPEANSAYARALTLAPEDAALHSDAGAALAAAGEYEQAIALFTRAIALQPGLAAAHNNLGNSLVALKRWAEATNAYRAALALDPDFPEAHGNLGNAALELLRPAEALAYFNAALAINPSLAEYHHYRGRALLFLGDLPAARAAHTEAVRLAPGHAEYYGGLAVAQQLEADDPAFHALLGLAETMGTQSLSACVTLHFALHRSLEHQGRHEEAFAHLLQGNALRRPLLTYDEPRALRYFSRVETVFTPALLGRAAPVPAEPDVPIFILGMPRSGSTLIEQILASHHDVFGAGELMYLSDTAATLGAGGLSYPENMLARSDAELAAAGAAYRARLRALAPDAPRITDKMPANFLHIGQLRLILPGARIIHTRRNPVDTCLSCFAQTFSEGQPFANDLGELGRHYRAYARLMAHWRRHLPTGAMLEVDYEDVVTDFEPQVRRILAFCGLDWDPACLDFHEHKRPVMTASAAQVRQKLYPHATGRAQPYGTLLQPLLDALAD
jgi:tetratricopeptide (TPR) repeat protein